MLASRFGRPHWIFVVALVAYALAGGALAARPQNLPPPVDRSQPPTPAAPTAGFSLRRLSGPVTIDRATWFPPALVDGTAVASQSRPAFVLTLSDPNDKGDVRRWRARFTTRDSAPVTLAEATSYAHVTIDQRWIVLEPIDVIDVRQWRRYGLSQAYGVTPYVTLRATSGDRLRLVFSRRACAVDCPGTTEEYFELTLPAAP